MTWGDSLINKIFRHVGRLDTDPAAVDIGGKFSPPESDELQKCQLLYNGDFIPPFFIDSYEMRCS